VTKKFSPHLCPLTPPYSPFSISINFSSISLIFQPVVSSDISNIKSLIHPHQFPQRITFIIDLSFSGTITKRSLGVHLKISHNFQCHSDPIFSSFRYQPPGFWTSKPLFLKTSFTSFSPSCGYPFKINFNIFFSFYYYNEWLFYLASCFSFSFTSALISVIFTHSLPFISCFFTN